MRKAAIVIGLGAFFLTMSLLLKFYAYDKLAVVPLDQNTQQELVDTSATFFDADAVKPGAGTMTTKARVIGDKALSEKIQDETGKDAAYFKKGQVTDNNGEAPPMDALQQEFVIDRYTGLPIHCNACPEKQNGEPIRFEGQLIKFPFQTQKQTYKYWDATAKKPMDMKFVGTADIKGLKTYKFEGTQAPVKFREQEVPRGLFGLDDTGPVKADRIYENKRTMWIEPETGVIINIQEQQHQVLKINESGAKEVNAVTTTSKFNEATLKKNVDDYKSKASLLKILRIWAPLALGILGVLLLLGGLAMSLANRGRNEDEDYATDYTQEYGDVDEGLQTRRGRTDGQATF